MWIWLWKNEHRKMNSFSNKNIEWNSFSKTFCCMEIAADSAYTHSQTCVYIWNCRNGCMYDEVDEIFEWREKCNQVQPWNALVWFSCAVTFDELWADARVFRKKKEFRFKLNRFVYTSFDVKTFFQIRKSKESKLIRK